MSVTEILAELPKLKSEERHLLFQRLYDLEAGATEETPEMLAAIDEADAAPHASDLSAETVREHVRQWAHSK